MKFKITVEKTKSVNPQYQLIIENIKTKLKVCIAHCELEQKEKLEMLYEKRAKLELVLND